jgi:glycopeptide antibiotics resistance protein
MIRRRPVLSILTLVYLVAVGLVTLTPQTDVGPDSLTRRIVAAITSTPLTSWMTYDGIEFTANIVMFVPGRVSDVRDLMANSLGALMVVGIGVAVRRSWRSRSPVLVREYGGPDTR